MFAVSRYSSALLLFSLVFTSPALSQETLTSTQLDSLVDRGHRFLDAERLEEAEAVFERVLELAPENVDALLGRASVRMVLKDWGKAKDWYEQA